MPVPGYLKFAPRIFKKTGVLPHYIVFFVTQRCTANCKHCLLGQKTGNTHELTLDEIEMMSRHMDPLLFLLITGGDPFIRDDISQIVNVLYRRPGFRNLGMPTNGFFTEKIVEESERILRDCPGIDFAVDVSIDGIGEDHDAIRQSPGLFEKAVKTYRELEKLAKRYENFNLNVAVTVSSYNHDKLDELYAFLTHELGAKTINHLLCRGDPTEKDALAVDMDTYRLFSNQLDRDMKSNILKGYHGYPFADMVNAMKMVRQRLIHKIRKENRYIVPCYAARLGVVIYPDGNVAPCELRDETLGNLRTFGYNFRAILESDEAEKIRSAIRRDGCHCTYECFLTNAVMFNPVLLFQVLFETGRIKISRLFTGGK
jgi:MoaA/NifB/PqqE/SkfB family radical SAM enzyme